MPTCFITREEFMETLRASRGEINATITFINPRRSHATKKTGVRFETKYTQIAQSIEMLAKRIGANVLHTITDDGLHVVTVNSFGSKTWTVK